MKFKSKSIGESLSHAFNGLKETFQSERNIRSQLLIGVLTIIMGFILNLNLTEWAIIVMIITMVLAAELFNTTIEIIVDVFCGNKYNRFAKKAKDAGAGAVLLVSIGALIIGGLILLPKFINLLYNI